MKSLYSAVSAFRKLVLFQGSVHRQTDQMDHMTRVALAHDVAAQLRQDHNNPATALQEIEQELDKARQLLSKSQEKETFLGMRSRQYRKALDERAAQLRDEQRRLAQQREQQQQQQQQRPEDNDDDDDEERQLSVEEADLERRIAAWEKDEDALHTIKQTHKQILVHCEEIRRTIDRLEKKREKAVTLTEECREFLDAAEQAEESYMATAQEVARKRAEQEEARVPAMEMSSLVRSAAAVNETADISIQQQT